MVKQIIGGVVVLVIGGSTFAVSQTDVINNLSKNTGMSQQQAQQYIANIPKSDLMSFSKIGQGLIGDGNSATSGLASIDCVNYTYKWETASLSCSDGKYQLQKFGDDEVTLGNCFQALDTNLGASAKAKIEECISDIDIANSDNSLPVASVLLDSNTITDLKNTYAYNKSILEAALKAK